MKLAIAMLALLTSHLALADIYQCRDASGSVIFSSEPCPAGQLVRVISQQQLNERTSTFDGAALKRKQDQKGKRPPAGAGARPAPTTKPAPTPAPVAATAPTPTVVKQPLASPAEAPAPQIKVQPLPRNAAAAAPVVATQPAQPAVASQPAQPAVTATAAPAQPAPLAATASAASGTTARPYKTLCKAYLQERQHSVDRLRQQHSGREGEYYRQRIRELDDSLDRYRCHD